MERVKILKTDREKNDCKNCDFVAYLAGSAYSSASTISPMLTENPSVSFL